MKLRIWIDQFNVTLHEGDQFGRVLETITGPLGGTVDRTVALIFFQPNSKFRYELRTPTQDFPNDLKGDELIGRANFERDILTLVEIFYREEAWTIEV